MSHTRGKSGTKTDGSDGVHPKLSQKMEEPEAWHLRQAALCNPVVPKVSPVVIESRAGTGLDVTPEQLCQKTGEPGFDFLVYGVRKICRTPDVGAVSAILIHPEMHLVDPTPPFLCLGYPSGAVCARDVPTAAPLRTCSSLLLELPRGRKSTPHWSSLMPFVYITLLVDFS
ncbi:hypothetical protein C8Q73DRAFT_661505 [Cubamyces lactineus]|nr:hypothetical protein C8Q73DRAFT_661505 [Cubamyces lactineus]